MSRTTLMPRRLRPTAMRMVLASAVTAVCAAGTMAGITVASASPAPLRAAHPAAPPPPAVDHHLCYVASGAYHIPPVKLFNQFSPKGFVPKITKVAFHCNPVAKFIGTVSFPITNPDAHLLCFRMQAATQPTPTVFVANQFGSAILTPSQPNLFCLPTWKSLKGPPKMKAPQPAGLSHFTCYPVTELPGTGGYTPPPRILLQDQFAPKPVPVRVSPVPAELCLPTAKVVGKKTYKIVNPVTHLLCFPVSQTPKISPVWDQNQFGTSVIKIGRTQWLCLPSSKRIVPVPVDHHLCYIAEGKYQIPPGVKLFNQFSPKGFVPKIGPVAFHCNPVAKTIPQTGQTFPITNPAAHLLCFRMAAARQPVPHVVQVANQFGSGQLIPGQPNLLCLPTWKSLHGPPNMKVPQPPGLSHFTCYPVKEVPGTAGYNPPPLLLQDQFAPKPVQVQVKPVPDELCLPTAKVVGKTTYPIINPITHLLCFPVTQTPILTPVFDQNQFGTSQIAIITTKWLCVPSTKKIIKP
jgi:hypothetical protein